MENDLNYFQVTGRWNLFCLSLFSELSGEALPKGVQEISKVNYPYVVIGLDRATWEEFEQAFSFFRQIRQPFSILWNDGPRLQAIHNELSEIWRLPN